MAQTSRQTLAGNMSSLSTRPLGGKGQLALTQNPTANAGGTLHKVNGETCTLPETAKPSDAVISKRPNPGALARGRAANHPKRKRKERAYRQEPFLQPQV